MSYLEEALQKSVVIMKSKGVVSGEELIKEISQLFGVIDLKELFVRLCLNPKIDFWICPVLEPPSPFSGEIIVSGLEFGVESTWEENKSITEEQRDALIIGDGMRERNARQCANNFLDYLEVQKSADLMDALCFAYGILPATAKSIKCYFQILKSVAFERGLEIVCYPDWDWDAEREVIITSSKISYELLSKREVVKIEG